MAGSLNIIIQSFDCCAASPSRRPSLTTQPLPHRTLSSITELFIEHTTQSS